MKAEIEIGISDSRRLIEAVNKTYNYDMSALAFTSLKRRIAKSMLQNEISNMDDFIARLERNVLFFNNFLKDITVEVTEMFRDPSFWRFLKDSVLPVLSANYSSIQIWVPNASTGEELYSLMVLLKEMNLQKKAEVYCSEINNELIDECAKGIIPLTKLEISEANYKRVNETGNFANHYNQVGKEIIFDNSLLEDVKFVEHNLTKLVQLKRGFHLILFRNNFIYYKSNLQENVLNLFHKSLTLNGYLVIGNKETVSWCRDAKKFTEINPNESVLKKTLV